MRPARSFYARFHRGGARRITPATIRYCFEEAISGLTRRPVMNLLAAAVTTLSLVAVGGVAFVGYNLNRIVATWGEAIQLNAYLSEGAAPATVGAVRAFLASDSNVLSAEFVSSEEALKRFGATFKDMGLLPESEDRNPFPASFEVRLKPSARNPDSIGKLAARLSSFPGIEEVDADPVWLKRLFTAVRLFRWAGWTVAAILVFSSVLTITNIIKLTLYYRQDEVDIMRLVGASEPLIRTPFVLEGLLQGLAGGALSLGLLFLVYRLLVTSLVAAGFPVEVYGGVRFLSPAAALMLLAFGAAAGLAGGLLAFLGMRYERQERHIL